MSVWGGVGHARPASSGAPLTLFSYIFSLMKAGVPSEVRLAGETLPPSLVDAKKPEDEAGQSAVVQATAEGEGRGRG